MTNKEAIEQLKWVKKRICDITYSPESFEALELAIKALDERPQGEGDLISRTWLKEHKFTTQVCNGVEIESVDVVGVATIDNAPPVAPDMAQVLAYESGKASAKRPQGEWIPVSERLPDNETEVLFQFGYSQSMMVGYHILDLTIYPLEFKDQNETGWYDSNDDFIGGTDEVIAWMPLPKPYKEADND